MTPDEIARLTSRLRGIPSRSAYWELGEIAAEAIDALAAAIAAERAAREKAEAELARQIECGREVMDISNRALEERNAAEERAEKAEAERDEALREAPAARRTLGRVLANRAAADATARAEKAEAEIREIAMKYVALFGQLQDARETALREAAAEVDCGCPKKAELLSATNKAERWYACPHPVCGAENAADILALIDKEPATDG